jgi:hypothetical protein
VEIREKTAGVGAVVALGTDELVILNNCLNEIANGVHLEDDEVAIRVGFSRDQIRSLLAQVNRVLGELGQ